MVCGMSDELIVAMRTEPVNPGDGWEGKTWSMRRGSSVSKQRIRWAGRCLMIGAAHDSLETDGGNSGS